MMEMKLSAYIYIVTLTLIQNIIIIYLLPTYTNYIFDQIENNFIDYENKAFSEAFHYIVD